MDLKDSLVNGGVLIVHQIHEGKHQYEVENVMKYKKKSGDKSFVRRGDKLMQINGMDLQDLTPEELAQALAKDTPMLTVHKACQKERATGMSSRAEDTLQPVSKESTILSFSMEMRREEDMEENEVGQDATGKEDGGIEEKVCGADNKENGERGDLLIISMKKTCISVVRGRGCDSGGPCQGCHGTGCTFNDVVMVSESSKVVLVPRGGTSFRQLKSLNTPIQHVNSHYYLQSFCSQKTLYASENPEEMTIYIYKSTSVIFEGIPVVLNFSNSNCFLRCCKEGGKVFLQVEMCEKQKLKKITMSDESTLSFLFYMKTDPTKQRKFESALHGGWFIQIKNIDSVQIATQEAGMGEETFLFIIETNQ
ncbi:LOW QUALITY PROTEIN: uncharacterized protein LOC115028658 [Cottoperca gobio]|uniref:LOW QUALITY PROTEIN: uncharacterized protein LOC115028658 n=1 Tax=Cottoperca gobio TaxID=56716 RepID=A0A6J2S565_COTGO|nr:LOW QUALITY PROTEIN: uncharacterized protein LOC115028658 [Cottoperca gobio]